MEKYYTTNLINSINTNSLPIHNSKLKKYAPIMLLRNLNVREGLANGTRLRVLQSNERSI